MITTVTGKNQVTVPAALARQIDLQPGTRLEWSLREDGVLLVRRLPRRGEVARKAFGMGRKWLKAGVDPVTDLIAERDQEDLDEGLA